MRRLVTWFATAISLFASCADNRATSVADIVSQWEGREILFPENSVFTIQGRDTVDFQFLDAPYKILSYVDSVECMSCKLHLSAWKGFIHKVDSISKGMVPTLLYFNAAEIGEIDLITRRAAFEYPVCYDKEDKLNVVNHFPDRIEYQTFLLDRRNRVVLQGNPIINPDVRNQYFTILGGETTADRPKTIVETDGTDTALGVIALGERRSVRFSFRNVGEHELVISDIIPSCDCVEAHCDKPIIQPNESAVMEVCYTPDEKGDFYKMVSVYCNTEDSPLEFSIYGIAEQ